MSRRDIGAVTGVLAVAGLLLTACGGASDGNADNAGEAEVGVDKSILVTAAEDACKLGRTTASTGSITFSVTNKGDQITEFYLYTPDGQVVSEVENISPGRTRDMTVQVSDPGQYVTACKPGMEGKGVRGDFTVTGGK